MIRTKNAVVNAKGGVLPTGRQQNLKTFVQGKREAGATQQGNWPLCMGQKESRGLSTSKGKERDRREHVSTKYISAIGGAKKREQGQITRGGGGKSSIKTEENPEPNT